MSFVSMIEKEGVLDEEGIKKIDAKARERHAGPHIPVIVQSSTRGGE